MSVDVVSGSEEAKKLMEEPEVNAANENNVETEKGKTKAAGKSKGKGKGKGKKGKGKGKGKGKAGKAKAKAKSKAAPEAVNNDEQGDSGVEKPKAKAKPNFRSAVLAEVGQRSYAEAMVEIRSTISTLEAELVEVESEQDTLDTAVQEAKDILEEATKKVQEAKEAEVAAYENVRTVRLGCVGNAKALADARITCAQAERVVTLIEQEVANKAKLMEVEAAKKAAEDAIEAAKKALEAEKLKEKAVAEQAKAAMHEQKERQVQALRDMNARAAEERSACKAMMKEIQALGNGTAKALAIEMGEVQKERAERDKEQDKRLREALGISKNRAKAQPLALTDGASPEQKKDREPLQETPGKASGQKRRGDSSSAALEEPRLKGAKHDAAAAEQHAASAEAA